jgi:hypothetical protein
VSDSQTSGPTLGSSSTVDVVAFAEEVLPMDAERFDDLSRALNSAHSRRGAAGLSIAGIVAVFGREEASSKRRRSCKVIRCVECTKCRRGRCKPLPNGTECSNGGECRDGHCAR